MVSFHRDGSACYHGEYQLSLQALLQGSCQGCGHRSEPSPAGDKWQWWQDAPTPKVSGEGQGGPTAAPLDTHGSRSLLTARLPCWGGVPAVGGPDSQAALLGRCPCCGGTRQLTHPIETLNFSPGLAAALCRAPIRFHAPTSFHFPFLLLPPPPETQLAWDCGQLPSPKNSQLTNLIENWIKNLSAP